MTPVNEAHGAWPVVSRMRGRRRGWCLPTLIHNMNFHYTTLFAFEDGVVDCWEGLDLELFRKKLSTGWISTVAPPGATLSVHGLGLGRVEQFEPLQSLDELEERVLHAIRSWNMNPGKWVTLGGEATTLVGSTRHAKLPMLDGIPCRLEPSEGVRLAREIPVFIRRDDTFRLTRWFVYEDGKARIAPSGALISLPESEEQILQGGVTMSIPDGVWVEADGVGRVRFGNGRWTADPVERVQRQRDHLVELQRGEELIRACRQQWLAYRSTPTPEGLERVRVHYLAVPRHLRGLCGAVEDDGDEQMRSALGIVAEEGG